MWSLHQPRRPSSDLAPALTVQRLLIEASNCRLVALWWAISRCLP